MWQLYSKRTERDSAVERLEADKLQKANEMSNVDQATGRKLKLQQKRNDISRKIRELGLVPEDAFSQYKDKSVKVWCAWELCLEVGGMAELMSSLIDIHKVSSPICNLNR